MKTIKYLYIGLIASTLGLVQSCKPDNKPDAASPGEADFSKYLAIGNSLTSGYSNNSLYRSGQLNSFPEMLAEQFKSAGGGDFLQPLLPGESGWPSSKLELSYVTNCVGTTSLGPKTYSGITDTAGSATNISSQGPFNNFGIPGIRCIDYGVAGYAAYNPYAARIFSSLTNSPMAEALRLTPTFFTVWLGSNDVLGYATNGGEGTVGGTATTDISPTTAFTATYTALMQQLAATGAKGVLINIPDITTIPFFTTVKPNALTLTATQATQLNAAYSALHFSFHEGAGNYFVTVDLASPGYIRQLTDNDYVLLSIPQDSLLCGGWGTSKPIPSKYVLSAAEVQNVKTATTTFNQVIAAAAAQYNLGLVDANAILSSLQSGITYDGLTLTPTFVTGGAFSLDGVHLTPKGYAMFANQVIAVINNKYHSTIANVNVSLKDGIKYP